MSRKRVYIAGPMSNGNKVDNFAQAATAALLLGRSGYAPICPQLMLLVPGSDAIPYETWMGIDFALIEVCDAVLRLPGHSPGADREVELANQLGIPVYSSVGQLVEYFGLIQECA